MSSVPKSILSKMRQTYVLQRTSSTRGVVLLPIRAKTLLSPCSPCHQCAQVCHEQMRRLHAPIFSVPHTQTTRIIYDERGVAEQVAHRLEQTCLFLIPFLNYYYYHYRLDDGPQGGGPPGDSEFHSTRFRPASHVRLAFLSSYCIIQYPSLSIDNIYLTTVTFASTGSPSAPLAPTAY
jgi:hypothetical protein